jgi:endo-1,4-beta-xylanase
MTQFRGRIYAWDVVNEALNDDGTYRSSPFHDSLGDGFIETAFKTARSVGDSAKLYYNDYNTEGINAKSDALYAIAKKLKKKKLIDGIGFQSHFIVGEVPTTLQANLQRFADLGLEVALTEIDIRVRSLSSPRSWIPAYAVCRLTCPSMRRRSSRYAI